MLVTVHNVQVTFEDYRPCKCTKYFAVKVCNTVQRMVIALVVVHYGSITRNYFSGWSSTPCFALWAGTVFLTLLVHTPREIFSRMIFAFFCISLPHLQHYHLDTAVRAATVICRGVGSKHYKSHRKNPYLNLQVLHHPQYIPLHCFSVAVLYFKYATTTTPSIASPYC